jgi:phage gp29-like protein
MNNIAPSSGFGSPNPPPNASMPGADTAQADPFRRDDAAPKTLPTEPDASIIPDRIQFSIRLRFNPIRDLTPERCGAYLDSFRLGFFRNAALMWDAMERRDDRLQTVAPKRKKSVARHGWEVLSIDDSPEASAQKEFLEYFYNHITTMTALEPDEEGGLSLLIRQMMDAVGKRYAVHEIVWQPQPDGNLTAKLIFCPLWWFEGTRGKLRFLLNEFAIYGVDMDEAGWMVTVADGLMEACSVAYIFKHLPLRDALSFSERFGTPGVLGKTEAPINSPEWDAMMEVVKNFSQDWAAVTNQTNSIELVEAKNDGQQPFMPLIDRMDEAMTRMWRGADLGTSSKHDANGASLQADETAILEVDDAVLITETLARKLSKYALQWKFGDAQPLAYIKIKVSEQDTTDLDLKVDEFLLSCGFPISIADTAERYGRQLPEAGADLLTPPVSPASNADTKNLDDDGDADIANQAELDAQDKLIAASRASVATALQDDLSHVLGRLNDIMQIQDDELFLKKLQQFATDYPQFKQDLLRDPATARALQPILGAALANGLATPLK